MEIMLKELLNEFKDFKNQVTSKFDKLEGRFDNLENRFDNLENRFDNLENRFDNLEGRFDNLEIQVDIIKTQQQENNQILRALEHKAEVHKAEMDNLKHQLAKIEGTVNDIKENQKSIYELLGEHEVAIRTLRRKPV